MCACQYEANNIATVHCLKEGNKFVKKKDSEKKLMWPKKLEPSTSPSNPYLWGEEMRAIRLKAKSSSSIGLKPVLPPTKVKLKKQWPAVSEVNACMLPPHRMILIIILLKLLLAPKERKKKKRRKKIDFGKPTTNGKDFKIQIVQDA
ncbi:exocyst complex component sec5 [Prunus dulcis]|uniref:Exocyst complex component sec5 n=1 Tax=Prunus dulcis TaxID=3755 RepID=A0A4Y1RB74_PRUDU|nr:exocyst complex component sec5 [Prunus dulcis]